MNRLWNGESRVFPFVSFTATVSHSDAPSPVIRATFPMRCNALDLTVSVQDNLSCACDMSYPRLDSEVLPSLPGHVSTISGH